MINAAEIKDLQRLISGQDAQHAYSRLFHLYFTPLLKFAVSQVRSTTIAEEIVSDVLFRLWEIRVEAVKINNLTVFLYTCIRNHCLNHLGKKNVVFTFSLDNEIHDVAAPHPDPEQVCISAENLKTLEHAVNMLPPKCRMIFRLIREDNLKYREVAELLGISPKTVEAQVGIAMKKLSEALQRANCTTALPVLRSVS